MLVEIPFSLWSALILLVLILILIVLILINTKLKYFGNYDEKEGNQFKLHFKDMTKK